MAGTWRPVHTTRWCCSVLCLEGLRLGLRP